LFVFLAIFFGGFEIALRAYPELISLSLLKRFHSEPRLEIAQERSLWNESQMWVLERDDGGPTLKLFKPHSKIVYDFHSKYGKGDTREKVNFHYRLRFPDETVEFNLQNADESEVRYARKLKSGKIDFSVFDNALSDFVGLASKHSFTPIVAYSPSAYTGYAEFVEFLDPPLTELMPWFSRAQREYLRVRGSELGYLFVDLTPALQKAERVLQERELMYHPVNVHFTMKGNRIVAETLAETISTLESQTITTFRQYAPFLLNCREITRKT
jgi:hypothetical protein